MTGLQKSLFAIPSYAIVTMIAHLKKIASFEELNFSKCRLVTDRIDKLFASFYSDPDHEVELFSV
jgi:hypothetical protein